MTTLTELERSPQVASAIPVVHRALRTLSNVRIRNVATLGGHLAHGDPHMDLPPILLTLGARVRAVSRRGERSIDLADLFVGYYQSAVARDELITQIEIPLQPPDVPRGCEVLGAVGGRLAVGRRGCLVSRRGDRITKRGSPQRAPSGRCGSQRRSGARGAAATAETFAAAADAAAREIGRLRHPRQRRLQA